MMLRTGNKGFTFLEVMVAAAVLALGAVLISETFFISLDVFNYYNDYLNVAGWADNKIWEAEALLRKGETPASGESGEFSDNNKAFSWNLTYSLLDEQTGLYSIDLLLSWKTGRRESLLSRTTYELLQQK